MRMRCATLLLVFLALLHAPTSSATSLPYQFVINTSSIAGMSGFLDLQLDPGPAADAAQANIESFSTNGTLYSSPFGGNSGDASGMLPGLLVLQNSTVFNDVFQGIDFGNEIIFDVTFSGTAISNPSTTNSGSTFSVGLYDSTASNPLLTDDLSGAVAIANIGPNGTLSVTSLPDTNGGPGVATITALNSTTPVPEPPAYTMLLTGCAALLLIGVAPKKAQRVIAVIAVFGALGASAKAAPQIGFATSQNASAADVEATPNSADCPNQGGFLQVISVPVANSVTLYIVVGEPSPTTTTFQITSSNPAIVGGSQNQGFIPQVTLQAGATTSSPFTLYGQSVGESTLVATDLSGHFGGFSVPVTSWDLNAGDSTYKLIDANPPGNSCVDPSTGLITTNATVLATCGTSAKGVATDGVTNLLMRLSAALPGTGCFAISSTSDLDQGKVQTTVTNTQSAGGLQDAFSLYTAPMYYGDSSDSRSIQFTFSYTPSQTLGNGNTSTLTANLAVVRPPVILIHGIWSNGGSWPDFYLKNNQTHWTFPADYSATNASSFSVNFPTVQTWVAQGLNKARNNGIAVTQADVIAHSMGGLLTRLYATSNKFQRTDNMNRGDIRRLITLDTPHLGASFANLIVGLHNAVPAATEMTVASITGGTITQGAVCDLSENSQGLRSLNASTMLTGMVVTATGAPAGAPGSPALYWNGLDGINSFEKALTKQFCVQSGFFGIGCDQYAYVFPQATVNGFRFLQMNDSLVALSSQRGGVAGGTNYLNLVHSGFRLFGFNIVPAVNNDPDVATQVYSLLDQSNTSFVSSFPAVGSTGNGLPATVPGRGNGLDVTDWATQCGAGGPLNPAAVPSDLGSSTASSSLAHLTISPRPLSSAAASPLVQITSPIAGQSFITSQTITVTVQVASILNATDGILFTTGLDEYPAATFSATGYTVSIPIPSDFTGPVTLTPAVSDINGNLTFGVPVTIGVGPSTAPISVSLIEHNYYLSPTDGSQELHLIGTFPDNLQLDLSTSAAGTTYISSDPDVITVDSNGNFAIAGNGIASITASNSGLSDYAVFVVEDPQNPFPALNVTNSASITMSGFTLNRQTGFFIGHITISAFSNAAIPGPLVVLLKGLPNGVSLVNSNGTTVNTSPGTPYISLALPGQGLVFAPGQSLTIPLQFLDPSRALISFTPSLIRTSGAP